MRGRGSLWAVVFAICMLALPAAAQAATWQPMADPAPGGVEDEYFLTPMVRLAVLDGQPFLSNVSQEGDLTVHTLTPSDDLRAWHQVGAKLNTRPVYGPAEIAKSSRTVWVAWRELTADGAIRVHVARLRGGRFKEIKGGLARTESQDPRAPLALAVLAGRPYVAYADAAARLRVVRLAGDDRQFRSVNAGLPPGVLRAVQAEVVGKRLYLAYSLGEIVPETTRVSRLAADRSRWRTAASEPANGEPVRDTTTNGHVLFVAVGPFVKRQTAGQLVQVDGVPIPPGNDVLAIGYANGLLHAFGKTFPAPDITVPNMAALVGGSWQPESGPRWEGSDTISGLACDVRTAQFTTSGDQLWFLWDCAPGQMGTPRHVHVAMYG